MGNQLLVESGIQTEKSDYRLHISFAYAKAYFFPTRSGRAAVEAGLGRPFRASQPGVESITGVGRKVLWHKIEDCHEIAFPPAWLGRVVCRPDDSTSQKGKKAVRIAKMLLRAGMLPIPLTIEEVSDEEMQMDGTDIVVTANVRIQVKCDYYGAKYGLALQTNEWNPFGLF